MKSVIILDESASRRDRIRAQVSAFGLSALCFDRVTSLLDNFLSLAPDLLLIGNVNDREQYRVTHAVKSLNTRFPILFFRVDGAAGPAYDANGLENVAWLEDACPQDELENTIASLIDASLRPFTEKPFPMIVGQSLEIDKIRKRIQALGSSMEPVLITGDSGTGKDLVAQSIHWCAEKEKSRIVKCSMPAFFHPNGSPSVDGLQAQISAFQTEANSTETVLGTGRKWTLMFDGIDHLPADHQDAFFQFLIHEAGGFIFQNMAAPAKTRIISTSQKDMAGLVKRGLFRKDLYHLLSVFTIEIPPLTERKEDIVGLSDFFCDYYSLRLSKACFQISDDAMALMQAYSWPGNVSELKELMMERVRAGKEDVVFDHIVSSERSSRRNADACQGSQTANGSRSTAEQNGDIGSVLPLKPACKKVIEKTEKKMIAEALARTSWNRRQAANLLKISYRSLLNKIKSYDIG